MVAYAALVSLLQTLDTVIEPGGPPVAIIKSQLRSLREKVRFLLDFLDNSSSCGKIDQSLETRIRDEAYEAGDIIESHIHNFLLKPEYKRSSLLSYADNYSILVQLLWYIIISVIYWLLAAIIQFMMVVIRVKLISLQSLVPVSFYNLIFVMVKFTDIFGSFIIHTLFLYFLYYPNGGVKYLLYAALKVKCFALIFLTYHELCPVICNISSITEEVIKIKEACGTTEQELVHRNVLSRRDPTGSGKNVVVGFDTDLIEMMTRLTSASPKMEIVSIVGMGGIGKTTLAREAYHEYRSMGRHFDTCAWVTISQEYKVRQVLVGLLETAGKFTEEMSENEDEQLSLCLYQSLKHRRYLIVLDDIWDAEIWDAVKMSFPEDNNGSRVVLTTRLASVALYASSL